MDPQRDSSVLWRNTLGILTFRDDSKRLTAHSLHSTQTISLSNAGTMKSSYDLPNEVLANIFSCLPQADRGKARLTDRRWYVWTPYLHYNVSTNSSRSQVGAEWLFCRVYFAPAQSSIERFNNIVSREPFRRNIKELVYDARLFVEDMFVYSKSLPCCAVPHLLSLREPHDVFPVF